MPDRHRVGMSFHRQAQEYDLHATVQKRVVSRLTQLVQNHLSEKPASILDIGCGTGLLLSALQQNYPHARLNGLDLAYNMACRSRERLGTSATVIQADAENLPVRDGSISLVVSTSTLQWLESLDAVFDECYRVMNTDGLLCIAFFGGTTLWELRECYRDVLGRYCGAPDSMLNRLHVFKSRMEVQHALNRLQFNSVMLMSEIETEYYPEVHDLLRSIKNIGAGAHKKGGGGLGWRKVLNEISCLYRERYQASDYMIPATYEVFYILASKSGGTQLQ